MKNKIRFIYFEEEIYELAKRKANVKGNEILYTDDSKEYIFRKITIAAIKQLLN
jgi:hypothetical protein